MITKTAPDSMHKDIEAIMFTKQEISQITNEIAAKVNKDFEGEEIIAVVILKGSIMFAADLIRCLTMNVKLDFMQASSYGSGTSSSGVINIKKDLDSDIEGKNVLIIEDIIDSGRTLSLLKTELQSRGAKTVKIAALLSKPERRVVEVEAEYIGAEIPDEFVVGYGLDFDEKYRQMDYIGILKPEAYM
ncbi:MAG: hypoxanthine phosphoribosyltransferase [Candidatus Ornithomonoglobus sp.]